ncbi:GNAT family N-acetyltransferase [Pyxidicoccus xibeiensis]|uniref:GNAT family N-acetyltransferase n=1 Tax=Pyxidicoccus xibeiensis TaxID=2906759 RepID=UPI0020A768CB|nr:GNAT family N-acetyltransferase [Pyxidicoccus xibeiensis]MCP3136315.1 GNAT family N-acetyltransferase [Pyxidicoccus xibeiensis]
MEHSYRDYTLRRAVAEELPALPEVERLAAEQFHHSPHPFAAGLPVQSLEQLREHHQRGDVWVAVAKDGTVAAFTICKPLDGAVFIVEADVHPGHARRGLGAALFELIARWARAEGYPALLLTTFGDVAWNAPYYERLGFRILRDDEQGPGLRAIREAETRFGLPPESRVSMKRVLDSER